MADAVMLHPLVDRLAQAAAGGSAGGTCRIIRRLDDDCCSRCERDACRFGHWSAAMDAAAAIDCGLLRIINAARHSSEWKAALCGVDDAACWCDMDMVLEAVCGRPGI